MSTSSLTIGDVIVAFDTNNEVKGFVVGSFNWSMIVFLSRMTFFNPTRAILPQELKEIAEKVLDAIHQIDSIHNNRTLAVNLADKFFGLLANFWGSLLDTGRMDDAKHYLQAVCSLTEDWENRNAPVKIHKGTPYFFLARTFRMQGDLDSTFLYTYSAVEEDKRSFGVAHRTAPAYMYASLVDNPNNAMYDYVLQMKSKIEGYIGDYQRETGGSFTYADFDRRFLKSTMDDLKHFFVYNLELLIKYEGIPSNILSNDFWKLKGLDTIFNLCLIVDKVLENKFHQNTVGGNVIELIVTENWGRRPVRGESFSGLLNFDPNNDPPDTVVPLLLTNQASYDGRPMNQIMSLFVLVWYLRNFGGHHIRSVNVFHTSFKDIIKSVMYALFFSVGII